LAVKTYPSTPHVTIPVMPSGGKSGGQDAAARAMRALERGATTLGAQVARSVQERWARLPADRREKLEALVPPRPDISEIEVRDLRADLTRELDRLAGANIRASRRGGHVAGEAPPADGQL
jgi:hypothetical protein